MTNIKSDKTDRKQEDLSQTGLNNLLAVLAEMKTESGYFD